MQEQHSKESVSLLLPSSQPIIRQAPGSNTTMRKYQQLTLAIVAVVSFVACVIYKHEYERLRYTLEYMDTFGEPPPVDGSAGQQCGFLMQIRQDTPPAEWTNIAPDIAVYSSYWDDNSGITEPKLRTIALVEKTSLPPSELKVMLSYENGVSLSTTCEMEKAEARNHVVGESKVFHIVFLLCVPNIPKEHEYMRTVAPHLVQFGSENKLTDFKLVHESDSYKSGVDRSAVCVIPNKVNTTSANVVEFISFYQVLGFQKFVFYGNGLTPVVRKVLNKFMDEMNIMVEEKSFNYLSSLQSLHSNSSTLGNTAVLDYITRQVIELDCQYRHRDSFENVVVLQTDEFIIPNQKQSLMEILQALSVVGGRRKVVSEFHLSTQHVCVDVDHPVNQRHASPLILAHQSRSNGRLEESGIAVLRPHLLTSYIGQAGVPGGITEQHVSPASAVVYKYGRCHPQELHADVLHLPTRINFVSLIEKSLLYRKWKIYGIIAE